MKKLLQIACIGMVGLILGASTNVGAQLPFCRFESMQTGSLLRVTKNTRGYEITVDKEIETVTTQLESTLPKYSEVEKKIVEASKKKSATVALLFQGNQLCDFLSVTESSVYVQTYRFRNNKHILNVCTDETDHCYPLTISADNDLSYQAEKILPPFVRKVVYVVFDENLEVLEIELFDE